MRFPWSAYEAQKSLMLLRQAESIEKSERHPSAFISKSSMFRRCSVEICSKQLRVSLLQGRMVSLKKHSSSVLQSLANFGARAREPTPLELHFALANLQ